jgi:putative Mg2+ transporter-C (MgtC) family protein
MIGLDWLPDTIATEAFLLICAFVLSAIVGLERQRQLKSAGIRTHTIVGLGAALFTLVSAYGFANVLGEEVVLDPSRIAAQIVSGIGFLGGGVIFVRQNVVNGLTTAASIWVTASIGMACGAGMPLIAALTTLLYLFAAVVLSPVAARVPTKYHGTYYTVTYRKNAGALRRILQTASALGYVTSLQKTEVLDDDREDLVRTTLRFTRSKSGPTEDLFEAISDIENVVTLDPHEDDD